MTIDINLPEVLAEMNAVFDRYEDALVNNKIEVLDELFWASDATVRYGVAENLIGIDARSAPSAPAGRPPVWRAASPAP